jgi:YHS domain-containing protein
VKDPDPFIVQQGLTLRDPVSRRQAVIDPATREQINYEIFYFADRGSLERFRRDPVRWCGLLTNPADQMRFRPKKSSPRLTWGGRLYIFPDAASMAKFQSMPDSLAERKGA